MIEVNGQNGRIGLNVPRKTNVEKDSEVESDTAIAQLGYLLALVTSHVQSNTKSVLVVMGIALLK